MTQTYISNVINLSTLPKDKMAVITGFSIQNQSLETRLREIGFAEGDHVTVKHKGLFGGNPISVSLNGALIALRKQDALAILVREMESKT